MRCSIVSDSLLAQGHGWRSRSISRCSTTGRGVTRRWAMRSLPGRWSRSSMAPRRNHRQPTGLLEEIVFSCRNNLTQSRVRPDDVLAIEVPDFRGASLKVKQSTLGLLMRAESLRIESDRLTALRDVLLPELLSGRMQVPVGGVAS